MSVRTRLSKLRPSKDKAWKQELPNLYTTIETKSRSGKMYTKRVRANKVKYDNSLAGYGFLTYLRSLPIIGGLFA